ncbi:MAG: hypothetical protein VW270_03700 [Candidatus Poseidoniales archaeon]
MTTLTNWWLDFDEVFNDGTTLQTSYGPFEYDVNGEISVQQFLDDINAAFDERGRGRRIARPSYQISAQILGGYYNDDAPKNNFAVKYTITTLDDGDLNGGLSEYQIAFRNGPHGSNTPVYINDAPVPRGEITIKSDMDTRAAVIPYSTHINTILDNPPVPPDIRIVPFSGVGNRLLLLLNSSTGEFDATPVLIKDTDLEAVVNQYVAQTNEPISLVDAQEQINNRALKITYKNDDPIDRYEIFRTTTKPNSYADFASDGGDYKTASGRITMDKRASGAHLIDDVQPNTKYYYCVRAIDVHNNFSNPTHVFEAELVDNEGQVYLILKTIYFEETIERIETKTGRRYIYIEPSLRNVAYNASIGPNQSSGQAPSPNILGPDGDADCWDKTLKIRVTSKKTGKKVDLNVTFKNSGVVTP